MVKRLFQFISEYNSRFLRLLLAFAALHMFLLSFLVVTDVLGRTIFNSPVRGTAETVAMSIVIISFLLAGYAVQSGGMLRSSIPETVLGRPGALLSTLITGILGTVFFILIFWGSFDPLAHSWATGEYEGAGSLHVPAWPSRAVVLAGSLLVALNYLGQALIALLALLGYSCIAGRSQEQR